MESKYYVPEISEFYVGFEFEYRDPAWEGREEFQPCVVKDSQTLRFTTNLNSIDGFNEVDFEHLLSNIEYEIAHNNIRVKYLDTSDIEEEGFKFVGKEEYLFEKDIDEYSHLEVDFDPEELTIVITELYQAKLTARILHRETREYNVLFNGKIKNKSEFKKVLKMLDIK